MRIFNKGAEYLNFIPLVRNPSNIFILTMLANIGTQYIQICVFVVGCVSYRPRGCFKVFYKL